jgi:BirA family biotin operon repressor/biotin-[acetyl-CoA-carboxylase] ligase
MNEYNKAAIEAALKTEKIGHPLYFYPETDTTNDRICVLALEGAPEGTLAVAEMQTAGRGRMGRAWQAPKDSGIWMSLLIRPDIPPMQASVLTLLTGIAIAEAIEEVTDVEVGIKWPNDILLNRKKLVGILTEMDCDMEKIHSVTVGMGINVNTKAFPEDLQDIATSLYLETGREYDRAEIVGCVMKHFEALYEEFLKKGGVFAPFKERYRRKCLNIGKEVRVIGRETYLAMALDITPEGELIVKRKDNGAENPNDKTFIPG